MQIKKGIQIVVTAILFLSVASYLVYAMIIAEHDDPEFKCVNIELNIEQNLHSGFINNNTIETELRNANIYPKDRLMSEISTNKIEEVLTNNEFIEKVECYKTANNKVIINITQITPVLYVLPNKGEGYYIDQFGKIITKKNYPVNMPVATGNISRAYAQKHLSKLGAFLIHDDFWNNQVEQIYVSTNSDKEYVIDLIPRVGNQTIHLGKLTNFEKKLDRLMVFYQKALSKIGWNKYSTINLEYEGQIICKKEKK